MMQKHNKFPRQEYGRKPATSAYRNTNVQSRQQQLSSDWIWVWGKKS